MEVVRLRNIWNKIITWNGMTLATVQWHNNPWKVLDKNAKWDEITDRAYKPIAEFYSQEDLWKYIKSFNK